MTYSNTGNVHNTQIEMEEIHQGIPFDSIVIEKISVKYGRIQIQQKIKIDTTLYKKIGTHM